MSYFGLIDVRKRTSENEQRLPLNKVEIGQKMKLFAYIHRGEGVQKGLEMCLHNIWMTP